MSENKKSITPRERQTLHKLLDKECDIKMSPELVDKFIDLGHVVTLQRRECIIREGERNHDVYIIINGLMRMWYTEGEYEITQAFGPEGTFFVSYHCYYAGKPSSVNYEACTPVKLLHINRTDFDNLLLESAEFARWNLRILQLQLYHSEIKNSVINGTVRERYETLLSHRPAITRQVPLKTIASYIGCTPEYLSKLRRQIVLEKK